MRRILIADDEELERKALRLILQEAGAELELVEAENGREAVEAARAKALDAAFLDVRMPGVDGIEAARLIREAQPDAPIVFLTAYDSFDYARQALRMGVDEYLLKPAAPEDVRAALERALAKGRARRAAAERLSRSLRSSLAEGCLDESAWAEYRALAWPEPAGGAALVAVALRLEPAARPGPGAPELEAAGLARAADLAERHLSGLGLRAVAGSSPSRAAVLAEAPAGLAAPGLGEALAELRSKARAELGLALFVGAAASGLVPQAGASQAACESRPCELCKGAFEAVALARPERPVVVTRCLRASPAEGAHASRKVEKAKAILEARLCEELSLESVAAELELSPSHLSRLFIAETGAGFGDFLSRLRVDRAKGLLSAGCTVKEAAALVGYRDPAYFARVFRRLEGASPGEYREGAL